MNDVRVRIAPSPTGLPHVGTAYIALFNYAFAKKNNGSFILRIEDTDQSRSTLQSELAIIKALKWLGLNFDESPEIGGKFAPYRQSERLAIYATYIKQLIDNKTAYYCFCAQDRLEKLRASQKATKSKLGYDRHCRTLQLNNALPRVANKEPYVVRLAVPLTGITSYTDELRGIQTINNDTIDDQVLMKSDGFPTYHFASVIDDHLMRISHIIRAEEWLISTPKHIILYKAFGWEIPKFIHMPLLRNNDKSKSKISKRYNHISLNYYYDAGYLPEAIINFLGNMGYSSGNNKEKYTLDEFIANFSIDRISLGAPVFDTTKLDNLNAAYMRELTPNQMLNRLKGWRFNEDYLTSVLGVAGSRITRLDQFIDTTSFFFNSTLNYDVALAIPQGKTQIQCIAILNDLLISINNLTEWKVISIRKAVEALLNDDWKMKDLFAMLRICISGRIVSTPIFETIEVLGKELCVLRINMLIKKLEK